MLEVGLDAVVMGQVAVATQLEAEELVGGLKGPGRSGQRGQEQNDRQNFFMAPPRKSIINPLKVKGKRQKSEKGIQKNKIPNPKHQITNKFQAPIT
jgi:hypothetical protein